MATTHCGPRLPKAATPMPMMLPTTSTTMPSTICIAVSARMARKRLPNPAMGYSRTVCSGVSMLSFPKESIDDLHPLDRKAPAALEPAGAACRVEWTERSCGALAHGPAGISAIIPPDCRGPGYGARGCHGGKPGALSEPIARARSQYYLHGAQNQGPQHISFLPGHLPRDFPEDLCGHVCGAADFLRGGGGGLSFVPERCFVFAAYPGAADGRKHRAAQDVDRFDRDHQAGGLQRNYHE